MAQTTKHLPISPVVYNRIINWVRITVALSLDFDGADANPSLVLVKTQAIIDQWKGNRGPDWLPTGFDVDILFESVLSWCRERTHLTSFPQE